MTTPKPTSADHRDIIERAGGSAAFARRIALEPNTVKAWKRLSSIPAAHWQVIADERLATLQELAAAAAKSREQKVAA